MKLSRRGFLGLTASASGLFLLDKVALSEMLRAEASAPESPVVSQPAVLVQISKCIGCRTCERACRRWNKVTPDPHAHLGDLSPGSWTAVKSTDIEKGGEVIQIFSKWQCMHCVYPTCVAVCPTNAMYKSEGGPVLYNKNKCIGCQYCVAACPFGVPKFDWAEARVVTKCVFCSDRIADGLKPACVAACPVGVMIFGERHEILVLAEEAQAKGAFVYGAKEAGGTSWIYVSDEPLDQRGFPHVADVDYPTHSGGVLGSQMASAAVGAVVLGTYSQYIKNKGGDTNDEHSD